PIALVISLVPVFLIQCVRFLEQLLTVIGFIYEKDEVKIQNVLTTGLEALFCIIFALSLLLLIFALFSKKLNRLLLFGLCGCTVASLLLCVTEGISAIL
ncbi:MAG: hypothetical protein IJX08_00660, partial [Clostridia bacterium]|nr:hypothetical protein [Clostridia bacterium]